MCGLFLNRKTMAEKKKKNTDRNVILKRDIPCAFLKDMVIFPESTVQFDIDDRRSVNAAEAAMLSDGIIFFRYKKDKADSEKTDKDEVGIAVKVSQMLKLDNGIIKLQGTGLYRACVLSVDEVSSPYDTANISAVSEDLTGPAAVKEALKRELLSEAAAYLSEISQTPAKEILTRFGRIKDVVKLADYICANVPFDYEDKLELLISADAGKRVNKLLEVLNKEKNIARARKDISAQIAGQVDEHQKEYILREQLSYIQQELGDDEEGPSETEQFKEAVKTLNAPDEVKEKLKKEIRHLELASPAQEGSVERSYIETVLELPWNNVSENHDKPIDIKLAKDILDRDHYGLKDVKERVVEYLAVRTLTGRSDAAILCLVGPPGTGKTSIAKSVAEATGKPYTRICLGGVRDEAEIRGHRKTYVGAMPGRVSAALKQAKVRDPLILLDEIDKMGQDYRGDIASAMLEVLDPEQNKNFRDHYIELPQDLSEVLFIATANDWENIPRPLLDRMEMIEIAGYTSNEKFHIAKEHLLKKTFEKNGIDSKMLTISDGAIRKIIDCYCRESGVRELERELSRLCRKAAVEILGRKGRSKNRGPIKVREDNLETYLGKIKFPPEKLGRKNEVGIARGLAWTSVGGTTLMVEVNIMPGKGELSLTGQLGDVMKESAMAALTYVRSVADRYDVKHDFFQNHDIHVHLPEGAVPKDGPSAGITMATAILSAVSGIKIDRKIAMTGEISLRGNVMPVGGLKEKILAAKTIGVETVLLPEENRTNVEEIDAEIKRGIELVFVKHMDEVLERAFVRGRKK